jgi:hypothetical protein
MGGYFSDYTNVWSITLPLWLDPDVAKAHRGPEH